MIIYINGIEDSVLERLIQFTFESLFGLRPYHPEHVRSSLKAFLVLFKTNITLAGAAQWTEHGPANQRVTSLIPSQGTCLGCRPGPQ